MSCFSTGSFQLTSSFNHVFVVPGTVTGAEVVNAGSTHVKLSWLPPAEPNGVVIGYSVGYKKCMLQFKLYLY